MRAIVFVGAFEAMLLAFTHVELETFGIRRKAVHPQL